MKKIKGFICFDMLKEGSNFIYLFIFKFQVGKKKTNMYKISCLHPLSLMLPFMELSCSNIGSYHHHHQHCQNLKLPLGFQLQIKGNKGHTMTRWANPIIISVSLLKQQP
jgi:hypothetical protein